MPQPTRPLAIALLLMSLAANGQAPLDDAAIEKLVNAGVGEQAIVAMIGQQPGKYALSSDDMIALKKAGVSDKVLAAMIVRNAATGSPTPAALALRDATPVRLRLTRDLTFTNIRPGEMVDFEILDDLRIDGLLVMARGRVTATITEAEPRTRLGRGGKLGVKLSSLPLLNGDKVAIRPAMERPEGGQADSTTAPGAMAKPAAPPLLFAYGKDEMFPEGTGITVYLDGEAKLDPSRFLADIAFTSNPPGALVTMYGAPIGRTPFTTRLAPGNYRATFSTDGYYDMTQSLSIGPGRPTTVHAAFELKP